MSEKAFLIDSTKCIGCGACQVACKDWNELPAESADLFSAGNAASLTALNWNVIKFDKIVSKKSGLSTQIIWDMFPVRCNHCKDAVCYNVCPVKAIYKVDGWTKIDHNKCIGCGSCQDNCPFQAVHVLNKDFPSLQKGKAYKCHGCIDKEGQPACVEACPTGALIYDYRLKLIKYAKNRVKQIKSIYPRAALFGLYQQKGLNVFTIVKEKNAIRKLVKRNFKIYKNKKKHISNIKDIYALLSIFTFGSKHLKRMAYSLARIIAG